MNIKKVFAALLVVGLVAFAVVALGVSGRESTLKPPHSVDIMYASEEYAYQMRDSSSNQRVRWIVMPDGRMSLRNSGGTTKFSIGSAGDLRIDPTALTWTAGTGWSITAGSGGVFTVDITAVTSSSGANPVGIAGAGVTVVLHTPTAETDGNIYTILKADAGTTPSILYCGGLPIEATGTTEASLDA
ncbi:MAG: hypothetical protein ACYS3N_15765, partial [Planctomycetota bacterium]